MRASADPRIATLRLELIQLEDSSEGRHDTATPRAQVLERVAAITAGIRRCDALALASLAPCTREEHGLRD